MTHFHGEMSAFSDAMTSHRAQGRIYRRLGSL